MNGSTTSASGWGVFIFLIGFTVLGTAAIGGGIISTIAGIALLVVSVFVFKAAREREGL